MGRLDQRVAIVTGAAQGIGEAITRRFVAEGARVAAVDRNEARLREVCNSLSAATACPLDVTDHAALQACVREVLARHDRIDILVNNAAVSPYVPVIDLSLGDWRRTIEVNLEAYFIAAKLVAGPMIQQGYGRIVNIGSTQAIASEPLLAAYAASKGGIAALTRTLAVEMAPHGILVNCLAPGCIHTPMSIINGVDETQTEFFKEWYVKNRKIPLARPGEPEEVAGAALFLASDDCTYITGHVLVVDGGLTITF